MDANPMKRSMPESLARHPRCGARSRRTGNPCRGPAMPNGRCKFHGGKSTGAPRGEGHGSYKHGRRTIQAREERQELQTAIRSLEAFVNQYKAQPK